MLGRISQQLRSMWNASQTDGATDLSTTSTGHSNQDVFDRSDRSATQRTFEALYGKGAKWQDSRTAGFANMIDAHDSVKVPTSDGGSRTVRLGEDGFREVQMRTHAVEAAEQLAAADKAGRGLRYTDVQSQSANPKFWDVKDGQLQLKAGVKPSDAMNDVFKNPHAYGVDCATGANLVGLRAIQKTMGNGDFDTRFEGLKLQGWRANYDNGQGTFAEIDGDHQQRGRAADLKPGDVTYFQNPDSKDDRFLGHNVVYLGDGQYFGHPGGIRDESSWKKYLGQKAGPEGRAPYLTTQRVSWGASFWGGQDRNPNDSNRLAVD